MYPNPVLTDSELALLSQRADAFYAALSRNLPPTSWEEFLTDVPAGLRPVFMSELVIIDIVRRWNRGERPLIEQYIEPFPELGPLDEVSPKLIAEEYRARLKAGDARDVNQYRHRFPVQFSQLEDELFRIEQESSMRGRSGSQRASGTVRTADMSTHKPASGTIQGAATLRPSGVIGSASHSRVSEYKRIKRLGAGQFGEVYLVESNTTGIKKALKVMHRPPDDEGGKRELRSLDLIKNEQHPYLLRTEDYWIEEGKLYVLMELADCTLRDWLAKCNPGKGSREYANGVPPGELLHCMREAAEVMDHLHEKQVLHRDIKPDNILLLNRHAKVADFGLARHQAPGVATQSVMAGSPAYMAPETWSGRAGAASDLYSLAVTYAELRQGRLPVKLGPMAEIMFAHLEGAFEFRKDIFNKAEMATVRKALAKEPAQRFGSCSEFVGELIKAVAVPLALPMFGKAAEVTPSLPPVPPDSPSPFPAIAPCASATPCVVAGEAKRRWKQRSSPGPEMLRYAKRKKNWFGVLVAGSVVLGLLAVILLLMFGGTIRPEIIEIDALDAPRGPDLANHVRFVDQARTDMDKSHAQRLDMQLDTNDAGGVIPIVVSTQASQGWAYHLTPSRANKVGSLTFEQPDLLRGSVRTTWAESGRHRVVVILGGTDDTASQVAQSLDAWLTPEDLEHLADLPTGPEADATIRDHIAKVLRDNGWTGSASEIVVALSFQVVTTE